MLSKAFGFGAPAVELEKLRAVRQRQELSDGNTNITFDGAQAQLSKEVRPGRLRRGPPPALPDAAHRSRSTSCADQNAVTDGATLADTTQQSQVGSRSSRM